VTPEELRILAQAVVERTTTSRGLPRQIEDPVVLARLAGLLAPSLETRKVRRRRPRAAKQPGTGPRSHRERNPDQGGPATSGLLITSTPNIPTRSPIDEEPAQMSRRHGRDQIISAVRRNGGGQGVASAETELVVAASGAAR
jgi:hypothetical protein